MRKRKVATWLMGASMVSATAILACQAEPARTGARDADGTAPPGAAQPAADGPRCVTSCSTTKPRVVVAEISWPMPERAASRQALTDRMSEQTLEVTTFKDGFTTGAYAQLGGIRESERFASRAAPQNITAAASFEALAVTRVSTLEERIASGASRSAAGLMPPSVTDAGRVVVIEVEGLEPGLNYYWRRSPAGPVVRCQAPVCPFDGGRR